MNARHSITTAAALALLAACSGSDKAPHPVPPVAQPIPDPALRSTAPTC